MAKGRRSRNCGAGSKWPSASGYRLGRDRHSFGRREIMKPILLVVALTLLAAAAEATCIKCDQSTGYRCYMSINGTKTHCDSPSDAGCFMWGVCTGASDCEHGCILNPTGA